MPPKKSKAAPKASKASKQSKVSKQSKASKVSKTPKKSKVAKVPKVPKKSKAVEDSEAADSSDATEVAGPESPDKLGKTKTKQKLATELEGRSGKRLRLVGSEDPAPSDVAMEDADPDADPGFIDEEEVVTDMKAFEADLSHSYVEEYAKAKAKYDKAHPTVKPKRATWSYNGPKPLNDPEKLPEGWTYDEPDLDKGDVEAQIKRCKERIAEQIMPRFFEHRLKGYMIAKKEEDEMAAAEKGKYSKEVTQRMWSLRMMEKKITSKEFDDRLEHLPNVKAILNAYRTRKLDWYGHDLVTYWSYGKQLCEPRPLHWAEFEALASKHEGTKSFWVEGLKSQPYRNAITVEVPPFSEGHIHLYHAGLKLSNVRGAVADLTGGQPEGSEVSIANWGVPGLHTRIPANVATHPWWEPVEFLHDTGAEVMQLYRDDIDLLMGNIGPPHISYPWTIGLFSMVSPNQEYYMRDAILVRVCMLWQGNAPSIRAADRITAWTPAPAILELSNYNPVTSKRLDGPWIRKALYTATAPTMEQTRLFSSTSGGAQLPVRAVYPRPPPQGFYLGDIAPIQDRQWLRTVRPIDPTVWPDASKIPRQRGPMIANPQIPMDY